MDLASELRKGITFPSIRDQAANLLESQAKRIDDLESVTYCAFCGERFPLDGPADLVTGHVLTCKEHPLSKRIAELEGERDRLHEFASIVVESSFEGDVDSMEILESGKALGIIDEIAGGFDPEKHHDASGACEAGDEFYMVKAKLGTGGGE